MCNQAGSWSLRFSEIFRAYLLFYPWQEGSRMIEKYVATKAHVGLRAVMSIRPRPPSAMGRSSRPMLIGIPCAFVRNCVIPPTIIWMINFFPSREGCPILHLLRLFSIFVSVGSQDAVCSVSLPIQAPSDLIGLPSLAILTWSCHGL